MAPNGHAAAVASCLLLGEEQTQLGCAPGLSLTLTDLGSSPCDTAVDLNAQRDKVDGLCQ